MSIIPRYFVSDGLITSIAGACLGPPAFAVVAGPIARSTAGELGHIRVSVTQLNTGAVAGGQTFLP